MSKVDSIHYLIHNIFNKMISYFSIIIRIRSYTSTRYFMVSYFLFTSRTDFTIRLYDLLKIENRSSRIVACKVLLYLEN